MLTILIGPYDILTIPEVPLIGLLMLLDQEQFFMDVGGQNRTTNPSRSLPLRESLEHVLNIHIQEFIVLCSECRWITFIFTVLFSYWFSFCGVFQ